MKRNQSEPPRIIARTSMNNGPLLKYAVKKLGADNVVHFQISVKDLRQTITMVLGACTKHEESSAASGM
jgi:hypothetical protein